MERRSDRYSESKNTEPVVKSRVNKNRILYDEVNSKIGFEEIPTYETRDEINLSSLDMNNLKRGEYQKVKEFKELMEDDTGKLDEKPKEIVKKKDYDINKVLEEAKKNRKEDELEEKRNINDQGYNNVLNNLNKKYLHQKGFSEEDNEELKELIDTITSKTLVDDIKDEEEKELLSELLATTIDIKLENELSQTQIQELADANLQKEEEQENTDSFYSKSLDLSKENLLSEKDDESKESNDEDEVEEDSDYKTAKIILIVLILLIVLAVVGYFVLQFLGVSFK